MKSKVKHWDGMYAMPLEKVPWEIQNPPKELQEVIEKKIITGGTALDVGCGTGNYSFYLAQYGFRVTGVDFSENALQIARERNKKLQLPVTFMKVDVTKLQKSFPDNSFDFILDYSLLHHLRPSITNPYVKQFNHLLKKGGKLLFVCYAKEDEYAQGNGKAKGKYGNTMYYRSKDEIRKAYKGLKEIYFKDARLGKRLHHCGYCFLFEK